MSVYLSVGSVSRKTRFCNVSIGGRGWVWCGFILSKVGEKENFISVIDWGGEGVAPLYFSLG